MFSVSKFSVVISVVLTGFIHGQSIIDGPDDATGQIGGTAQFHCTVEFGVFQEMTWEFNDKIIYSFIDDDVEYPMGFTKYNVTKKGNSFTLQVRNLNYTDGGQYTCVAFLPTAAAMLVVLGKPSIMIHPSHPVEGQSVNLTCAAQFGGPVKDLISTEHYPELLMYLFGKLLDIPTSKNQNKLSKTHFVMAETRMNGQELSCQVRNEMSSVNYTVKLEILSAEEQSFPYTAVFVVIGILVGLCLLGIAIFLYFKRKRKQNNKKKSPGNEGEDVPLRIEDVENQPEKVKASSHTKRLRGLISQSEYVSDSEEKLIWSEDLILKVKESLEKGADPNWISSKEMQMENRGKNCTAQYKFFSAIVHILLFKGDLFNQIKSLVLLFMKVKSHNSKFIRGNALHALVEVDWKWLSGQTIPEDFLSHFHEIILACTKENSSIINETDWNGRAPLHLLFQGLQLQEEWLEDFTQIVQHLRSNKNIDIVDNTKRTALHYFIEAFSKLYKDLSGEGRKSFLNIFCKLDSDVNLSSQDENGNTVLHVLAKEYTGDIFQHNRDFLFEVIKHLSKRKCDFDAKDKQGCTVLHIFADAYPTDGVEGSANKFIELMKHLAERSRVNIKDNEGNTVLHILANKYNRNMTVGHRIILFELIKAVSEKNCDVDVQDKNGHTIMHLLVDTFSKDEPDHDANTFIELMEHFIKRSKGNIQDHEGYTVLHILANNYEENLPVGYHSTVFQLVKILQRKTNPRLLDRKKCTVLHILANKCSRITSEVVIKKYYDIMNNLLDEACNDMQNEAGCTILHIMIRNYKKNTPVHCHKVFENLTKILITKTNINAEDRKGQTVLHTLVEKYPAEVSQDNTKAFLELVKYIAAKANRDIVDKDGCTVLHIFVKKYKPKKEAQLKGKFLENVKMLKSDSNINIPDALGHTPLHIVLKTMFYYQHFGQVLLPTIEILTSVDNVNMQDQLSITPFSWALQGIQENTGKNTKFKKMFEEIEHIFTSKGADRALATNGCAVIQQHKNTLKPV